MVTLNRIYTRTGDQGFTRLVGGAPISKTAPRVWAYGEVDELNAHLGMCRTLISTPNRLTVLYNRLRARFSSERTSSPLRDLDAINSKLAVIQNELFDIGSELATPPGGEWPSMPKTAAEQVSRLESWIDEMNEHLPELKSFVLPGGTLLNAQLHIARTVCRRAERYVLALKHQEEVSELVVMYLNRLSDLLFVMSRYAARCANAREFLWIPGNSRSFE